MLAWAGGIYTVLVRVVIAISLGIVKIQCLDNVVKNDANNV